MNFAHPLLEKAINIKEGEIVTLVIENPFELRNTVNGIMNSAPELVLSENFSPIEISKYAEFITDIFAVDFTSKKILTKIADEAEDFSEDFPNETLSLLNALNNYGELISEKFDYPIKFSFAENAEKLIKLLNFTVDDENIPFPENLLTYMDLCRNFLGKKLFIFLNFKSFVSDSEFQLFCQNIAYENFRVMTLEAYDCGKASENEKKIIVDNDLCVICNNNL